MTCPNCKRPNAEGLSYCDFCGTPLHAAASATPKRRTEADAQAPLPPVGGAGGGKRVTEMELAPPAAGSRGGGAAADPFDPFNIPSSGSSSAHAGAPVRPAAAGFEPARPAASAAAPDTRKRRTEFDAGTGGDPFAPSTRAQDPFAAATIATGASAAPARAAGRRAVGWLITFDGHPDGLSFTLREGRNVIGRDADNDIALSTDPMLSRTHAFLIWRAGRARIADNATENGTFLNDADVLEQVEVKDGDVIRVGRTRFLVRLLDPQRVAALWPGSSGGAGA